MSGDLLNTGSATPLNSTFLREMLLSRALSFTSVFQPDVTLYCTLHRVPDEIKRREVELDPQVSPEEIMSREVELGCVSWTYFASGCSSTAVQRTLSL